MLLSAHLEQVYIKSVWPGNSYHHQPAQINYDLCF